MKLFFKALPDKTTIFKGGVYHGKNRVKDGVLLLLGANMSGTDKLLSLMTEKFRSPRRFKGIESLPFHYKANTKARMTRKFFSNSLKRINKIMY